MALSPGSRVGAYEVLGSLGAGGMGEVYRARDTRLGREVALKILPDAFAADHARRDSRDGRLHVARAGEGEAGRRAFGGEDITDRQRASIADCRLPIGRFIGRSGDWCNGTFRNAALHRLRHCANRMPRCRNQQALNECPDWQSAIAKWELYSLAALDSPALRWHSPSRRRLTATPRPGLPPRG
jgi:hypothetical protein